METDSETEFAGVPDGQELDDILQDLVLPSGTLDGVGDDIVAAGVESVMVGTQPVDLAEVDAMVAAVDRPMAANLIAPEPAAPGGGADGTGQGEMLPPTGPAERGRMARSEASTSRERAELALERSRGQADLLPQGRGFHSHLPDSWTPEMRVSKDSASRQEGCPRATAWSFACLARAGIQ